MRTIVQQENVEEWNRRANRSGLHAVFSTRWSKKDCTIVNTTQQELIFSFLPDLADKKILDLGCGIGRLTKSLYQHTTQVIGLDISTSMLVRARMEFPQPSALFVQASAGYVPFPDAQFDVIIASYVLQHILDNSLFQSALSEISRILKIGGIALLVDSLDSRSYQPTNSTVTTIRTEEQYTNLLEHTFQLLTTHSFRCVDDDYVLMLWKRKDN